MGVEVMFSCGGCDRRADGTGPIKRTFESFSGRSHGIGVYRTSSIEDVTPSGWVAFDPYTLCTYCPACWDEIVRGIDGREKEQT